MSRQHVFHVKFRSPYLRSFISHEKISTCRKSESATVLVDSVSLTDSSAPAHLNEALEHGNHGTTGTGVTGTPAQATRHSPLLLFGGGRDLGTASVTHSASRPHVCRTPGGTTEAEGTFPTKGGLPYMRVSGLDCTVLRTWSWSPWLAKQHAQDKTRLQHRAGHPQAWGWVQGQQHCVVSCPVLGQRTAHPLQGSRAPSPDRQVPAKPCKQHPRS